MRLTSVLATLTLLAAVAAPAAAQAPTVEWQIAAAVLPLPDSMRAGAEVLGTARRADRWSSSAPAPTR